VLATSYFAAMVVRDILAPRFDPVRTDGVPEHEDDPGGGVLDGAPDVRVLRLRRDDDDLVGAHGAHSTPAAPPAPPPLRRD